MSISALAVLLCERMSEGNRVLHASHSLESQVIQVAQPDVPQQGWYDDVDDLLELDVGGESCIGLYGCGERCEADKTSAAS